MKEKCMSIFILCLVLVTLGWAVEGDVDVNNPLPQEKGQTWRDTVEVVIGTPYIGNVIPFWGATYNASRFQVLFLQSEINTSGDIIKFAFMPSSAGFVTCDYYDVRVQFCHTSVTQLVSSFDLNYAGNTPVPVLTAETLTVGGAQNVWMDWNVSFPYNNVDNLLVEIQWNGDAGTNIALWRTAESVPRRLYAWDDHASSGSLQNTGNHVRLTIDTGTGVAEADEPTASITASLSTTPNPFVNSTSIAYTFCDNARVNISIYDASGRLVNNLVNEYRESGSYQVQWNGCDDLGRALENGVYFCRMQVGDEVHVQPVVYLK